MPVAVSSPLRAVLEVVVRALVDRPDSVRVTETERRGMSVLELRTAPDDMGKIIGRQGRTAAALRTLIAVTAEKHGTTRATGHQGLRSRRLEACTLRVRCGKRIMNWDDMVLVGRVARTHGLRGDVIVHPETDFVEERFHVGATMWTRSGGHDEQLTVGAMRLQNGRARSWASKAVRASTRRLDWPDRNCGYRRLRCSRWRPVDITSMSSSAVWWKR